MKKPYYKELPLFHIYDSNLTGESEAADDAASDR